MFCFTKQERFVLVFIFGAIVFGSGINFVNKRYPQVRKIISFLDRPNIVKTINVNSATEAQLIALPGIGPKTAKRIIDYRQKNGQIKDLEELKNIKGIKKHMYQKIRKFLRAK